MLQLIEKYSINDNLDKKKSSRQTDESLTENEKRIYKDCQDYFYEIMNIS